MNKKKKTTPLFAKIKLIKSITILLILILVITFGYFKIFKKDPKTYVVPNAANDSLKITSEETIVNKIHEVNKLISLQLDLKENMIIDNSWGDWEVFKKIQKIHYYGVGSYAVDLSNLSKDKVNVDKLTGTVTITIPKPQVDSVTIDRDKTTYETTDNGLLRFGDIKLKADEYNFVEKEVMNKMKDKLNDKKIYDQAVSNTKDNLKNILQSLTKDSSKISINIEA